MQILKTVEDCRRYHEVSGSDALALVPTMGALHHAHMALIARAKTAAAPLTTRVVVSIFVNPLQFGPKEDFERYPRPLEADLEKCREAGVDAVFVPEIATMYPEGLDNATVVIPSEVLTNRLCGLSRPGHFSGVATVVLKLFHLIQPTVAVFGEKDAQQLHILQRMVRDLIIPVSIVPHPVVREANGLAVSSRNAYLTTPDQQQAALIPGQILRAIARQVVQAGEGVWPATAEAAAKTVLAAYPPGAFELEYLEAVDAETFAPVNTLTPNTRLLIAGRVGTVRLIDTMRVAEIAAMAYPDPQLVTA